ncbi:MAG TPA: hypothetical protein VGQ37_10615 [Vicinamibacterales bacterium]|jgi:hypothetical protein|nr:hypothetical protein [Vicinamibacterales bacterium]
MQVKEYGGQDRALARRRFLGSAVALGAGAAIGATVSFPSLDAPLAAASRQDLVHDELIRQLTQSVRALRGARPAEAARSTAATLRLLAPHYHASGVDADVQKRLRAAIARDGRDAVLRWQASAARRAAEASRFGVVDLALPGEPFNLPERERALDAMLARGVTPALLAVAAELSRLAPDLDRATVTPITRRQCPDAHGMAYGLEFVALAAASLKPILGTGFDGAYFGLRVSLWYTGC